MRTPFSCKVSLVFPLVLWALFGVAGCAKQGRGDWCDKQNGNQDCQDGLICGGQASALNYRLTVCCASGDTECGKVVENPTTDTASVVEAAVDTAALETTTAAEAASIESSLPETTAPESSSPETTAADTSAEADAGE